MSQNFSKKGRKATTKQLPSTTNSFLLRTAMISIDNTLQQQRHVDALLLALASSTDNFTVGLSMGLGRQLLFSSSSPSSPSLMTSFVWANLFISICNAIGAWVAGYSGYFILQQSQSDIPDNIQNDNENNTHANHCFFNTSIVLSYLPSLLAAIAFGILAIMEFQSSDYYQSLQIRRRRRHQRRQQQHQEGEYIKSKKNDIVTTMAASSNTAPDQNDTEKENVTTRRTGSSKLTSEKTWVSKIFISILGTKLYSTIIQQHVAQVVIQVLPLAIPMTLNNLVGGIAGGAAGMTPTMTAIYAFIVSFVTMTIGFIIGQRMKSQFYSKKKNEDDDDDVDNNSPDEDNNNTSNKLATTRTTSSSSLWDPSLLSACLLVILSLMTLSDVVFNPPTQTSS